MSRDLPVIVDQHEPEASTPVRSRDATNTRELLLQAARRRFAYDGYAATTVRDIAADAGVNVALINRYFASKEGLFEACLARAAEDLGSPDAGAVTLDDVLQVMITQVAALPNGEQPLQLLLLLRSSGDERADRIRRNTLQSFAERMAEVAGWRATDAGGEDLILRAQIMLATGLGIVLLRSSSGMEPLTSATGQQLGTPLGEVLTTLLSSSPPGRRR
ncbi:MAG TPA: TetR family transcriptional regulator [Lacisediminihabitans sp.]|uniref:TetR/AcrR family transcriptional regulator n=1 Tax=Lacisediminihabitans sp. TaxID=2787631 RepID=UPI002EDA0076